MTEGEGADVQEGVRMRWCTFQNPNPTGVSIQLWTASEPGTWVDKVLDKRGEYVHHVCFLSDDFDTMCSDLAAAGVPLLLDAPSNPRHDAVAEVELRPVGQDPRHPARARHALPTVRQPLDRPPRQRREPRASATSSASASPTTDARPKDFHKHFRAVLHDFATQNRGPARGCEILGPRNRAFLHDFACGNLFPSGGGGGVQGLGSRCRSRTGCRRRCWWSWPASPSSRASTPCCAARWPGPR